MLWKAAGLISKLANIDKLTPSQFLEDHAAEYYVGDSGFLKLALWDTTCTRLFGHWEQFNCHQLEMLKAGKTNCTSDRPSESTQPTASHNASFNFLHKEGSWNVKWIDWYYADLPVCTVF
jgi:hypothetical protein